MKALIATLVVFTATSANAQQLTYTPSTGASGTNGTNGATGSPGSAGATGATGSAATVAAGTVSTLSPGASATVTNAGTSSAAIFNFGIPSGLTGSTGAAGSVGSTGATGATGPAGPSTISSPNTRTLSLATAYQCTDNMKPCIVVINLQSTATISLSGGTTNTGNALIGSTNGVASGTGTILCAYTNSNTGALTIGLNLSTIATSQCTLSVPIGWFFAIRQIAGTVTITSAFDQSLG